MQRRLTHICRYVSPVLHVLDACCVDDRGRQLALPRMPVAAMNATIDVAALHLERNRRLREVMARLEVPALLTADPINVGYACGHRNMTVYGLMGPSRLCS